MPEEFKREVSELMKKTPHIKAQKISCCLKILKEIEKDYIIESISIEENPPRKIFQNYFLFQILALIFSCALILGISFNNNVKNRAINCNNIEKFNESFFLLNLPSHKSKNFTAENFTNFSVKNFSKELNKLNKTYKTNQNPLTLSNTNNTKNHKENINNNENNNNNCTILCKDKGGISISNNFFLSKFIALFLYNSTLIFSTIFFYNSLFKRFTVFSLLYFIFNTIIIIMDIAFYEEKIFFYGYKSSFLIYLFVYIEKKSDFYLLISSLVDVAYRIILFKILRIFFSLGDSFDLEKIILLNFIFFISNEIQRFILNLKISKYLPFVSKYIMTLAYSVIFEFLLTGLYLSTLNSCNNNNKEINFKQKNYSCFLSQKFLQLFFLDLLRIFFRKYKIFERFYNNVICFCRKKSKEIKYNDFDDFIEICSLESQFLSLMFLLFHLILNFIFYYGSDLNYKISDCKGTPNPKFFFQSFENFLLVIILFARLVIVVIFINILLPKSCNTRKIYFPSFKKLNSRFAYFFSLIYFILRYGYQTMIWGIMKE